MAKILKMRIHSFGDLAVLQADTVEPSLPDASQVLVRIKAASVNPVDFKIRSGKYPAVKEDRLPYALGRDVSGVVEQCGAQATQYKMGDEVFGIVGIGGGGYAEKVALDQRAITRKPSAVVSTPLTSSRLFSSSIIGPKPSIDLSLRLKIVCAPKVDFSFSGEPSASTLP